MRYLPIAILLLGIGIMASGIANISYAASPAQTPPADEDSNGNGIADASIDWHDINYSHPTAADFPLPGGTAFFNAHPLYSEIVFEGAEANDIEGRLVYYDGTQDQRWQLPNHTGRIVVSGQPRSIGSGMYVDGSITPLNLRAANAPEDGQCAKQDTTYKFGWGDCIEATALKASLLDALANDPDFRRAALFALLEP